jgi:hypothetical protein
VVIGISSSPIVNPGDAICHVVRLKKSLAMVEQALGKRRSPARS